MQTRTAYTHDPYTISFAQNLVRTDNETGQPTNLPTVFFSPFLHPLYHCLSMSLFSFVFFFFFSILPWKNQEKQDNSSCEIHEQRRLLAKPDSSDAIDNPKTCCEGPAWRFTGDLGGTYTSQKPAWKLQIYLPLTGSRQTSQSTIISLCWLAPCSG